MTKVKDRKPAGYWHAVALRQAELLGPNPTRKTPAEANAAHVRARNEIDEAMPQLRLEYGAALPPLELLP